MNYTGIDYHKRYSVACTLDAQERPERVWLGFGALNKPLSTLD
jgi:hypothetical protein